MNGWRRRTLGCNTGAAVENEGFCLLFPSLRDQEKEPDICLKK